MELKSDNDILHFIKTSDPEEMELLFSEAQKVKTKYYGTDVYFRGLIEFTNYCMNDCYYCGLRCSNKKVSRYRLSPEEIMECCRTGDKLGYKTFVLQGGDDPFFTDKVLGKIIRDIRNEFPNHAITVSVGERSKESYKCLFDAGATRYLLRHETASDEHYNKLHPESMGLKNRKECLYTLRELGYQVGAGFMVGSPFQTPENLLEDLRFLIELDPHMVGIGPFIPQADTPFASYAQGNLELTLRMLALTRILLPKTLLPATTALGTISPNGRELGFKAGANVVMPNLSPNSVRKFYALYDNKAVTGDEAAESLSIMKQRILDFGLTPNMARGDSKHCPRL